MATNDYKAFAAEPGANVMTQADYLALAALATGFVNGIADPTQLNKVWRQSSVMTAALAQLISDALGVDVLDNGDVAALEGLMVQMLRGSLTYDADTGAANAYVLTPNVVLPAYAVGISFSFVAANTNTAGSTLNISALGNKALLRPDGTTLKAGDIIAGQVVHVEYDGAAFRLGSINSVPGSMGNVNYITATPYNVTTDQLGQVLYFLAGSSVVNMPDMTGQRPGSSLYIAANATVTFNAHAGQLLDNRNNNGAASISLKFGEDTLMVWTGVGWVCVGGSYINRVSAAGGLGPFGLVSNAAGYQKLPSGLIVQWLTISGNATSAAFTGIWETPTITFTYPVSFPNAPLCGFINVNDVNPGTMEGGHAWSFNTTAGDAIMQCSINGQAMSGWVLIIGF